MAAAATLGNVITQLNNRVGDLRTRSETIAGQHVTMAQTIAAIIPRLSTIRGHIQAYIAAQAQIAGLHQNIQDANARLEACTANLRTITTERDDLQNTATGFAAIRTQRDELIEEHATAVEAISTALLEIESATNRVTPLVDIGTQLQGIVDELDQIETMIDRNPPIGPEGPGTGGPGGPGTGGPGGPGGPGTGGPGTGGPGPGPGGPGPGTGGPGTDDDDDGLIGLAAFGVGGRRRTRKGGYRYGVNSRRSKTRRSKTKSKTKTRKSKSNSKSKTHKSKR